MKNSIYLVLLLALTSNLLNAQKLNKDQIDQLRAAVAEISVDSIYLNGNWEAVHKSIEDKQIVLLGEFNHGVKEVFDSRNDLIKSLHEKLNFDIILFEAGFGEMAVVDKFRDKLNGPYSTLGFSGVWRTPEFIDLMDYIKEKEISVGGFDVQRTGSLFESYLGKIGKKLEIDSTSYNQIEERFGKISKMLRSNKVPLDSVQNHAKDLIDDYSELQESFEKYSTDSMKTDVQLINRTLHNRINYIEYFLKFKEKGDWNERWKDRDLAMAQNILWSIKNQFSGKKIIVIAHNFHISHFNENEDVMGEFLKQELGDSMFTIGTFASKGSYSSNSGKPKGMKPPSTNHLDVKHLINVLDGRVNYLDISSLDKNEFEWFHQDIIINDTFIDLSGTNKMNLPRHFDAILFYDKVSPPGKIDWGN